MFVEGLKTQHYEKFMYDRKIQKNKRAKMWPSIIKEQTPCIKIHKLSKYSAINKLTSKL